MFKFDPFAKICWEDPDGGAGGGGGGEGAGDPPPAGGEGGGDGAAKWWEGDALSDEQRTQITAMGLTVDNPVEAVARLADMERAAKQKLGKGVDQLMDRPAEGQDIGEWLRSNGALFGVPEAAEGYEIAPPDGWPKDAEWNADMETAAREIAHKHGVSGAALQEFVGLYAGEVGKLAETAATNLAAANIEMQAELQREWGDQYAANVAQAKQAASLVMEKAGVGDEAILSVAELLKPKVGDAGLVKIFATIGSMMGEDSLVAGDGGAMGMTPAAARAKLQEMRAEGGDYYNATKSGNRAEMKRVGAEMDRLTKIAVQT